jgi:hypothetical protein
MGQIIRVDFSAKRRVSGFDFTPVDDPTDIAKRIRKAITKAQLMPKTKVSVRTRRSPTVIQPHRIIVTVKGFADQAHSDAYLDWALDPETKHTPRPRELRLDPYTPAMTAVLRTLRAIINLHPGDYESELDLAPQLYAEELADHQRARLLTGVTS